MKLHTVFIAYNRLELTKQAVASYVETVDVPYTLVIVDNGSTDGTQEWLRQCGHEFLLLGRNRYPGYACNVGWSYAPTNATHLHRADNDFAFLPGWCQHVRRAFSSKKKVGQVGLRTGEEENWVGNNVGGNNVILRKLFDQGLRYDERPWPEYPPGWTEDSYFSPAVLHTGYRWVRVEEPSIRPISGEESLDDPYYAKTWADRRIHQMRERRRP